AASLPLLRAALEAPSTYVRAHDYKTTWVALRRAGIALSEPGFDTMIAGYLLNPNRRSPTLEALSQEYLAEPLLGAPLKKTKKADLFESVENEEAAARAGAAACAVARLQPILAGHLAASGLTELFERIELPLTVVLGEI